MKAIGIWTSAGHPPEWLQALYDATSPEPGRENGQCGQSFDGYACTRDRTAAHDVHFAGYGTRFGAAWVGEQS